METIPQRWDIEVDFVSVGSGTGGLVGAMICHDLGLRTVILESSEFLGGGSAMSSGLVWIPNNHHMLQNGLSDSTEEALNHLRRIGMGRNDDKIATAYVENGPSMLKYVEEQSPLKMTVVEGLPDYNSELIGGKVNGRSLVPNHLIMAEILLQTSVSHPLLNLVRKSWLLNQATGMPEEFWAAGRALVGGLLAGCLKRGIETLLETRATTLIAKNGKVIGVRAIRNHNDFFVKTRYGVLLCTGGFEWNNEMTKRFLINDQIIHPITPPSNCGDGHIMGMELGAAVALMDRFLCSPTIRIPGEKRYGTPLYRLFNKIPAGSIAVNPQAKRFFNESIYTDAHRAFTSLNYTTMSLLDTAFLILDQRCIDKSSIGILSKGSAAAPWLSQANTLHELAQKLGIPSGGLVETVQRYNNFSKHGVDLDFQRGETQWERHFGDPEIEPNPCLATLEKPPFYGTQLFVGNVGCRGGLVTDENSRVINHRGHVIPGLYACGNTAAHLAFGDGYVSGASHGQSMVFGYLAAKDVARRNSA